MSGTARVGQGVRRRGSGSRRAFFLASSCLLPIFLVSKIEATELRVEQAHFVVDGQRQFLLGISYYGALGAARPTLIEDLDAIERKGFRWIRVWATWSAFGHDVSAIDTHGEARAPFLDRLKWLVAECDRRGLVVDITLTRGEGRLGHPHLSSIEDHERACVTLTQELHDWRNWYLDLANEHNLSNNRVRHKFVSIKDARRLRDAVKSIDPRRLVTISFVGDLTASQLQRYVDDVRVDVLSPHRPRHDRSAEETVNVSRRYLKWMGAARHVVPIHFQEPFRRDFSKNWQPAAEDFLADLRGAVQGGAAGWCFHNGDNRWAAQGMPRRSFDLSSRGLWKQLDTVETQVVNSLARSLKSER